MGGYFRRCAATGRVPDARGSQRSDPPPARYPLELGDQLDFTCLPSFTAAVVLHLDEPGQGEVGEEVTESPVGQSIEVDAVTEVVVEGDDRLAAVWS